MTISQLESPGIKYFKWNPGEHDPTSWIESERDHVIQLFSRKPKWNGENNFSSAKLTRNPVAVVFSNVFSTLFFTKGTHFERIIPDAGPASENPTGVKRVVFCTGKVYYELNKERSTRGMESEVAITRVEQVRGFLKWLFSIAQSNFRGGQGLIALCP